MQIVLFYQGMVHHISSRLGIFSSKGIFSAGKGVQQALGLRDQFARWIECVPAPWKPARRKQAIDRLFGPVQQFRNDPGRLVLIRKG